MEYDIGSVPDVALFKTHRVTVGMLLILKQQGVVLVQSSKGDGMQWILPQGGVNPGESFLRAFLRESEEELPGTKVYPGVFLDRFYNNLPPERGKLDKNIFFFDGVLEEEPLAVDGVENTDLSVVYGPDQLFHSLCATRPHKREMILDVVKKAHEHGKLNWSCERLRARARRESIAA